MYLIAKGSICQLETTIVILYETAQWEVSQILINFLSHGLTIKYFQDNWKLYYYISSLASQPKIGIYRSEQK